MRKILLPFCIGCSIWLGLTGCSKSGGTPSTTTTTPPPDTTATLPSTQYDISQLGYTSPFQTTPVVNPMVRQDYNELSGIAASRLNAGILYVHDDNGNSPIIITNANGADLGTIILDNVKTVNPEDIRVGPGPDNTKTYIYYADIGDNNTNRGSVAVYRFPEPVITSPTPQTAIHITAIDKIEMVYPVVPLNAETLLVDPLTKDIYLASKQTSQSTLYTVAYPQSTTGTNRLTAVVKTPFDLLTSGDISPDGTEILLRDNGQIWYWKRPTTQSILQTILTAPSRAPFAGNETQGEGVGFAADGSGYYTDIEIRDHGGVSNISFYKRN